MRRKQRTLRRHVPPSHSPTALGRQAQDLGLREAAQQVLLAVMLCCTFGHCVASLYSAWLCCYGTGRGMPLSW